MIKQQWLEVRRDFDNAIEHLRLSVELFEERSFLDPSLTRRISRMGLMQAIQMGYNYFEHGLEKIILLNDEYVTDSPNWSVDLIAHAATELPGVRPAIISKSMQQQCRIMIDFRAMAKADDLILTRRQTSDAIRAARVLMHDLKFEHHAFRPVFLKQHHG